MTGETAAVPHMSDETIRDGSGRTWAEWVTLLDAWGSMGRTHTEIARHVGELGVDGWWAQSVTVGYERIKGLREAGQRRDGTYQGSVSKTLPVSVERLFEAFADASVRDQWLEPGTLALRTAQAGKSARFDHETGIVAAWFTAKGEAKAAVQLQIEGLPSMEAADAFKAVWKHRVADLATFLTDSKAIGGR